MSTIELNTQEVNEKEVKIIANVEPLEFPGLITTMYCDTVQIAKLINNYLKPLFPDCYGVKVEPEFHPNSVNKSLSVVVVFTDKGQDMVGNGQYKALEPIVTQEKIKNSLNTRLKYYNNLRTSNRYQNVYQFTKAAKDILGDLVPNSAIGKNGKINWKDIMSEFTLRQYNAQNVIGVSIVLDFNKILKKIYGHKTEDQSTWNYLVLVGNPLNPQRAMDGSIIATKWQVFILRLKDKDVFDLASRYGYDATMGMNRMGIITD